MINPNNKEPEQPKLLGGFTVQELQESFKEVTSLPADPNVNHPAHYNKGNIECLDAIAAAGHSESFCIGSCLKYLWRYKHKNGIEDLKKAQFYLNWCIDYLQKQEVKGK